MSALPFPLDLTRFRALFIDEFGTAPDALIQARLDQAELQINASVWGDRAGEGQAWLAAHLLATSPSGKFARLMSEKGRSTYGDAYEKMVKSVTCLVNRVM